MQLILYTNTVIVDVVVITGLLLSTHITMSPWFYPSLYYLQVCTYIQPFCVSMSYPQQCTIGLQQMPVFGIQVLDAFTNKYRTT